MEVTKINEPIRVLAAFGGGRMKPLRFVWRTRTYTIERLNGEWIDRQEQRDDYHYSIQIGPTTYFLHFASQDLQWWLDELAVQG